MSWLPIAIRWLLGIGLLGMGISYLAGELNSVIGLDVNEGLPPSSPESIPVHNDIAIGNLFLGFGFIIAGAIVIAPDIVRLAASPLLALIDSIFLPGQRGGKPDLNLKLPQFYREQCRYDDAMAEYRKIIRYYPEQVEGWIGAMELLVKIFDEPEAARKLYEKGRRKLRHRPEAIEELAAAWENLVHHTGS
ncbi:MAG: hypothetical protein KDN19_07115 [Verrucomicrobiae bacterium]|nr:hypothetical protein [Verrucomicrobiae bacterium]